MSSTFGFSAAQSEKPIKVTSARGIRRVIRITISSVMDVLYENNLFFYEFAIKAVFLDKPRTYASVFAVGLAVDPIGDFPVTSGLSAQ